MKLLTPLSSHAGLLAIPNHWVGDGDSALQLGRVALPRWKHNALQLGGIKDCVPSLGEQPKAVFTNQVGCILGSVVE